MGPVGSEVLDSLAKESSNSNKARPAASQVTSAAEPAKATGRAKKRPPSADRPAREGELPRGGGYGQNP